MADKILVEVYKDKGAAELREAVIRQRPGQEVLLGPLDCSRVVWDVTQFDPTIRTVIDEDGSCWLLVSRMP